MARILIILWLSPIVLFSAWLGLSAMDWHLGLPFMTREVHDRVFEAYRLVLGYEREELLVILRNALLLDAALLSALIVWRRWDWFGPRVMPYLSKLGLSRLRFASRSRHA